MDGELVPGPFSGAPAGVARGRPRAREGGLALLLRGAQAGDRGGAGLRRAVRAVPELERPLPADRVPGGAAGMKIREATEADRSRLRELSTEFVREIPPPADLPLDLDHELSELDEYLSDHLALVAENGGEVVAFALAKLDDHPGVGVLSDLYVAPGARRQGAARELIRQVAERLRQQGAEAVTLGVQIENADARAMYERLGFEAEAVRMFARVDQL